jgi:hypothetical protein
MVLVTRARVWFILSFIPIEIIRPCAALCSSLAPSNAAVAAPSAVKVRLSKRQQPTAHFLSQSEVDARCKPAWRLAAAHRRDREMRVA